MCAFGLFREINFKKIGVSLISRKNFVRGSYLPSVFRPGKLPPPPLSGLSQLEFSSKTSQSGSLDDDVLVRSFSVSWDVDISDRRQLTPLGENEDL